jgi:hypothetical protein
MTRTATPIVSLLYAALADPAAAAMLREFLAINIALPVVSRGGCNRPELRAGLLSSQLIGFGLARYVLAVDSLAAAPADELTTILGDTLQHTCTGPLGEQPALRRNHGRAVSAAIVRARFADSARALASGATMPSVSSTSGHL